MRKMKIMLPLIGLLWCEKAIAQLAVTVSPPKVTGQKAVVALALKNSLSEKIESARAVVFLLDEHGKMAGQATKWVIGGGKDRPVLLPGATNLFNFVVQGAGPFTTTNLTAKVSFSRVVLEGGKLADVNKEVKIQRPGP
jgi:hypothetical protein